MNTDRRLRLALAASTLMLGSALGQNGPASQQAIPGVINAGAKAVLVKAGFRGVEGPAPAPDGSLYFSEVDESRTYRLDTKGAITVWREGTKETNGLYLMNDGRLLCAQGSDPSVIAVSPSGTITPLATSYKGIALRRPNDLIADKKGGVYFTDPAPRPAANVAPKEPGNVYYIRANGELVLIDEEIQRPNGITLSSNEMTLYVDDTEGEFVYAFDVQSDGSVKNKRQFVKLHEPEKGTLGPRSRADGMAIDSRGCIYVGTAAGVQVIDPRGVHLGTIRLPGIARNLAFGGPKRRTLFLTMADALYRIEMLSQGPSGRSK